MTARRSFTALPGLAILMRRRRAMMPMATRNTTVDDIREDLYFATGASEMRGQNYAGVRAKMKTIGKSDPHCMRRLSEMETPQVESMLNGDSDQVVEDFWNKKNRDQKKADRGKIRSRERQERMQAAIDYTHDYWAPKVWRYHWIGLGMGWVLGAAFIMVLLWSVHGEMWIQIDKTAIELEAGE